MKRFLVAAALAAVTVPSVAGQAPVDYSTLEITTTDLGQGVYLLNWQGGDSLFLVGEEGVLLVDTSVAPMGPRIREAIAAKPTQDLDARWAPRGGFLSGDVITRMAYQSLKGISPPARP